VNLFNLDDATITHVLLGYVAVLVTLTYWKINTK
jgi:hypothetical protein